MFSVSAILACVTMPSAQDLVSITGSTSHLGFRLLVDALHAGYNVNVALRSQAKADTVLEAPSVKTFAPSCSQLSFVIVETVRDDGAYDEAVKGVQYIIRVASHISVKAEEIPAEEFDNYFIQSAECSETNWKMSTAGWKRDIPLPA